MGPSLKILDIWSGNPPCKKLGIEVEFSRYEEVLHEAVEIYG
jgi:hypothetical protein